MSRRKSDVPQSPELALSTLCVKISLMEEQMENLDSKVNLLVTEMKKLNLQLEDLAKTFKSTRKNKWIPETSFTNDFHVDLDKLIKNIEELNLSTHLDEQHIQHTPTGATLKRMDYIPITIYSDGLAVSNERLKLYSDKRTLTFIEDIMDGYFPAELQHQYPEGVFFKVLDKRNELGGKGAKVNRKVNFSVLNPKPDAIINHGEKKVIKGFHSLQEKLPRGQNEIHIKILSDNGDKACTVRLSSTETKVGYLLRQLANGENARLLIGYPSKPLTEWNDRILDAQSTPTLAECGITENCLLRLQFTHQGELTKNVTKGQTKINLS